MELKKIILSFGIFGLTILNAGDSNSVKHYGFSSVFGFTSETIIHKNYKLRSLIMTSITINGKIMTVLEKKFEDKKTVYAQFLMESESKGMEIIKVKIINEADIQKLEKDLVVSIPVSIVGVNGNLYYSQADNIRFQKEIK